MIARRPTRKHLATCALLSVLAAGCSKDSDSEAQVQAAQAEAAQARAEAATAREEADRARAAAQAKASTASDTSAAETAGAQAEAAQAREQAARATQEAEAERTRRRKNEAPGKISAQAFGCECVSDKKIIVTCSVTNKAEVPVVFALQAAAETGSMGINSAGVTPWLRLSPGDEPTILVDTKFDALADCSSCKSARCSVAEVRTE